MTKINKIIKSISLHKNNTISQAIKILDREDPKIVLVIDEKKNLIATITDGDIRRGLIKGFKLADNITKIMHRNFEFAKVNDDEKLIKQKMKNLLLKQIPILDEKGRVVDIRTAEDYEKNKKIDTEIIIMAGGLGKRLMPLTKKTPKPMLKIGDKPILEKIIVNLADQGFYNFTISTFYKSENVKKYFKNGKKWGIKIKYINEKKPMGTAGSLSLIKDKKNSDDIIIINGDVISKVNYLSLIDYHKKNKASATICVKKYEMEVPYGVIKNKKQTEEVINIYEKPVNTFFVNAGIYVINMKNINTIKPNTFLDMPMFLNKLINKKNKIFMFPIHEFWIDIGEKNQYEFAKKNIK